MKLCALKTIREAPHLSAEPADTPERVAKLFREFIGDSFQECVAVLVVDPGLRPTHISVVYKGTPETVLSPASEILRTVLMAGGTTFFVAHNHPSGRACPSQPDILSANRCRELAEAIGLTQLDHIIIGEDEAYSLALDRKISYEDGEQSEGDGSCRPKPSLRSQKAPERCE